MFKTTLATLAAIAVAGTAAPALAKEQCNTGYKAHLGQMVRHFDTASASTIAEALRKGLAAYDSCKAGDSFSTQGLWDQIEVDVATSEKK